MPDKEQDQRDKKRHEQKPAPAEPGRTPGQAEGTVGDVEGEGHAGPVGPGRTPGQAEGTVGDVEGEGHPDPVVPDRPKTGRSDSESRNKS